jgi:DNA-directed RNA polymerase I subunit RPA2
MPELYSLLPPISNRPIQTNRCHLDRCSPAKLIAYKEESEELGGYFIINGNERLIRMLVVGKRNFPMAIIRGSFVKRGTSYTKYGIQIRSVRPDQTSQTNVLHYLNDGNITFRFTWRKAEYLVPVIMILRALVETNDRELFEGLVGRAAVETSEVTSLSERVEMLLRAYQSYGIRTKAQALTHLGEKFRLVLGVPEDTPAEGCGEEFLQRLILPHLGSKDVTGAQNQDKFRLILFMIRKLYALVSGDCSADNPDAPSNQEILLGGYLYGMVLKEKLEDYLLALGGAAREWSRTKQKMFNDTTFQNEFLSMVIRRTRENIGGPMEYFLSTGNIVSRSGLDLQQVSGYTVVAEKINFFRFLSHFRMVHRGSFFAQLKTTTVRKLLPESWGFLCPVHTPDGTPCGLLNHLAHKCVVATKDLDVTGIPDALARIGVSPPSSATLEDTMVIQLDGRVLGYCRPKQAQVVADTLRYWKVQKMNHIPIELEIGYVPPDEAGAFPGIFMFSQVARMYRPVLYLPLDTLDFVGPFEQPFMSIAVSKDEIDSGISSHIEITPTHLLSIIANQTPFSDFNQSPRNMYQCQMGKQAMGTPGTSMQFRTDNKSYKLQTGQTPIVRPPLYNEYGLDNFPNGMNAVVAVISYTGYDMDDAMIINKSAHERGFGDGCVYKVHVAQLDTKEARRSGHTAKGNIEKLFGFNPSGAVQPSWRETLDEDGLPQVGVKVSEGDVICAYHAVLYDPSTESFVPRNQETLFQKYRDQEDAYIEEVRILGSETGSDPCQAVSIKYRIPRRPVVGDKFSSRHGQKGVCSKLYPAVDMPFSESGMQPDVIINPHAFPSRMTIGMFVESVAGKAGALHGHPCDSTPFAFNEQSTAADFFGEQLMKAGYNYHGNEPMYSGITGTEFDADIYIGVVYYQRLRHMVNDKFQVRTTGPVNRLTGQPVKGRKKGGGIRVGEMERDALIAHGTVFLLQDRLFHGSDAQSAWICRRCGSFHGVQPVVNQYKSAKRVAKETGEADEVRCRRCARRAVFEDAKGEVWEDGTGDKFVGGTETCIVNVPGVLRFLDAELAAMGVKLRYNVGPAGAHMWS